VFDIAVIGAGIMGLATAAAASMRGASVVVFEQHNVGHSRGSSHGNARIFKLAYSDRAMVQLATQSQALWRELETVTDTDILNTTGTLDVGDFKRRAHALAECGVDFEALDSHEVDRRFGYSVDPGAVVLYQADGGVLQADRAIIALRNQAEARGARIVEYSVVSRLDVSSNHVGITASTGEVEARVAVVTAGAWSKTLLEPTGIRLPATVTRETVTYLDVEEREPKPPLSQWGSLPLGAVAYGLFTREGNLKVGLHRSGPEVDGQLEGIADSATIHQARIWAKRTFRLTSNPSVTAETCLYTNLPDERFLIRRYGRIIVGSACSGHGFKFAPIVGKQLATLALE